MDNFYVTVVTTVAIFLLTACQNTSTPTKTGVKATLAESIDTYLDVNQPNDGPGIATLIIKEQAVLYSDERGMATFIPGKS